MTQPRSKTTDNTTDCMTSKQRRNWYRRGGRANIIAGTHRHKTATLPAVLIVDSLTGNVLPLAPSAAYLIADKLVAVAEELEGRTSDA